MKKLSADELIPYQNLRVAREYRNVRKKTIADILELSEQTYGQKELGKEGGLEPYRVKKIIDFLEIDSRFIFGQLNDINKADLRNPENKKEKQEMIEDFYNTWKKSKEKEDPIQERLNADVQLKECVKLLIENRSSLSKIMGYLEIKNIPEKRERDAV